VYASQRRALGIPLGTTYLGYEDFGDRGVIAATGDRTALLSSAALRLLACPAVHTIKLKDEVETARQVRDEVGTKGGVLGSVTAHDIHSGLTLGETFDEFLQGLTKLARRNLLYYRRKASGAGLVFVEQLSTGQLTEALEQLIYRQRTSALKYETMKLRRHVLQAKPGTYWAGLCDDEGRWLALTGGWLEDDRAFMLCQLNHDGAEYAKASLSTVLRSHLIETLIARGASDLTFLGGCRGILEPFCRPVREYVLTIEKAGPCASLRRAFCGGAWRGWGAGLKSRAA
jgi:hypothetical protein